MGPGAVVELILLFAGSLMAPLKNLDGMETPSPQSGGFWSNFASDLDKSKADLEIGVHDVVDGRNYTFATTDNTQISFLDPGSKSSTDHLHFRALRDQFEELKCTIC